MQIDFHHTAIYVLCRLAGMQSSAAEIVAYASQQVDDATHNHALKFKNGGVFRQTRTSHHGISRRLVDISDAFEIWIPFHFLPGGEGNNISEKLITRPEGRAIQLLKEDIINSGSESYSLYRLGIGLHLYADAYSHQDFKGFYNDYNDIDLLKSLERKELWDKLIDWIMGNLSFLAPVGHGQALKNPDIPYAKWSYIRHNGEIVEVDNLIERFSPAINNIYDFIVEYLQENTRYANSSKVEDINEYKEKMISLLSIEGDPFQRHEEWLNAIHSNFFQFVSFDKIDKELRYNSRAWFDQSVKYLKAANLIEKIETYYANYYNFYRKEVFSESDWVKYMRAAAIHKYRVLHKILPECGLDIG